MQFSVDDYYPPEWTAKPTYKYYFQIIKEGNLLGKIQIKHKDFNLIGRLEDLCDIYIDNPLVSRKHAILQAKKDDSFLYLMDLGSQHGTFVNRVQLPPKTYKKIEPFDSIKFGVSSRVYILRCPEFEQMKENEENERENQFSKMLEEQHRKVSKEEMKAKYLDMLENDPYFAANQGSRQLVGKQPQEEEEDQYAGIDWGITDQRAVYAYKNDNEFPIEPDLLRRLNLDALQLTKLSQYEDNLRRYQEIEAQLNELTSQEKRQYGLQEKLRNKKEKTEKKFMEALQAVEKCEDWLRTHIFGEVSDKNKKNAQTIREKENDTFGDDIFLDRTLQKNEVQPSGKDEIPEAETFWLLQAKFKSQTQEYEKLKQRLCEIRLGQTDPSKMSQELAPAPVQEEDDELDLFMKQNKIEADQSNIDVLNREMTLLQKSIEEIRIKLVKIVGEEKVNNMVTGMTTDPKKTLQEEYLEKNMEQTQAASKKKMNQNRNIEEILDKLEKYQKNEEEFDENKEEIFKYYKEYAQEKEDYQDLDQEQMLEKLRNAKRQHYDPTLFEKPANKLRIVNDRNPTKVEVKFQAMQNFEEEEQAVDLTKKFK